MSIADTRMWLGFSIFVVIALTIDTVLVAQSSESLATKQRIKHSIFWTLIWIALAFIFNFLLWIYLHKFHPAIANATAINFLTGYLIEKSLSVDNLFAFYMVFSVLKVPNKSQQWVFAIGIWSAIVLRLVMILAFGYLVSKFSWLLYVMGVFLLVTGIKMLLYADQESDLTQSKFYIFLKNNLRFTAKYSGKKLFVYKNKLWYATPLVLALILIEFSDIIFAFDSIPAIFAVTKDPFIVWSSNIFAILGLRALYFVLAAMVEKFKLLKYGVAIILIFIGVKMLIEPWLHIPVIMSLGFVLGIITLFVVISWRLAKRVVH